MKKLKLNARMLDLLDHSTSADEDRPYHIGHDILTIGSMKEVAKKWKTQPSAISASMARARELIASRIYFNRITQWHGILPLEIKGLVGKKISARTIHALSWHPILRVVDLAQKTESVLLGYRNLGRGGLTELKNLLAIQDLSLGFEIDLEHAEAIRVLSASCCVYDREALLGNY